MGFGRVVKADIVSATGRTIEITKLRVAFSINLSSQSDPNVAEIQIYNLNEQSLAFLEQKELKIVLSCGYETSIGDLKVVFDGEIQNSTISKNGQDRVATLFCGDADTGINLGQFQKTYRAGYAIKDIIKDLASSMGVIVLDENLALIPTDSFINSYVAVGPTKKTLDDLFKKIGMEWYVLKNVFYAANRADIDYVNAININSKTGMIGTPMKQNDKNATDSTTEQGIHVNSVLNPDILPGVTVNIESKFGSVDTLGYFTVKEVKIQGDTHAQPWHSKFLCIGEKQNVD